jgi:CheY-like chemotaxis protein
MLKESDCTAEAKDNALPFSRIDCPPPLSETILVVEDNEGIREGVAYVLQECGYRVATVTHGEEAIAYLAEHELPCAILLDLNMPVMNGWDFRQWQQRHAHFANIPVIIMSGARESRRTYEVLRPEAYIAKPIDFNRLLHALHTKTNCKSDT